VFGNRVLRRIYGAKKEEVAGGSRRLHSQELHNLYISPNIRVLKSRRMRWAEYVAWMGEIRKTNKMLVGKPKGKRQLGTHRCG
jgi:hypothetical protein